MKKRARKTRHFCGIEIRARHRFDACVSNLRRGHGVAQLNGVGIDHAGKAQGVRLAVHAHLLFARH